MNAADILKYGQQTVLSTFAEFPESAVEQPGACGTWSVKDIMAHLTSFELVLVDVLSTFTGMPSTGYLDRYTAPDGQFNDAEVDGRRSKTMPEVLAEFNDAHARASALAAQIAPETFRQTGTLPWYGADYALDDFIVYAFYGHKREHSAQIATFRDTVSKGA